MCIYAETSKILIFWEIMYCSNSQQKMFEQKTSGYYSRLL